MSRPSKFTVEKKYEIALGLISLKNHVLSAAAIFR